MKFGVVTFPGSNCDQDMVYVLEKILNRVKVSIFLQLYALNQFMGNM